MVFIEWPETDMTEQKIGSLDDDAVVANAQKIYNDETGNVEAAFSGGSYKITSLKRYIEKYSYGKLSVQSTIFPRVNGKVVSYVSPKSRSYYLPYSTTNTNGYTESNRVERERELLTGATDAIKTDLESTFTKAQLDTDNDGNLDAISYVVADTSFIGTTVSFRDLLWSHKSEGNVSTTIHDLHVNNYDLVNAADSTSSTSTLGKAGGTYSLNRPNYKSIFHEFMHVLGLPDLYRATDSDAEPVGLYDVMGNPQALPQSSLNYLYSYQLGWSGAIDEITTSQSVTLYKPDYQDSSEKRSVIIRSPLNANQVIVVDYYDATEEPVTSNDSGLVTYRVNKAAPSESNIEATSGEGDDYIFVYRKDDTGYNVGNGDLTKVPLTKAGDEIGNTLDENTSYKSSLYYSNQSNSGIKIKVTSTTSNSITFSVTVPHVQGAGTKDDPYQIVHPSDLDLLRGTSNETYQYFELMNDLDLSQTSFSSIPSFYGSFNGNDHTIKNINMSGSGFFEDVSGSINQDTQVFTPSIVKNLRISDIALVDNANGENHMGAVAGMALGKFENVHVTSGSILNTDKKSPSGNVRGTGGFVGYAVSTTSSFVNCSTQADVKGYYAGGFVGLFDNANISNCYAFGHVSGTYAGGFKGGDLGCVLDSYVPCVSCYYNQTINQAIGATGMKIAFHDGSNGSEGMLGLTYDTSVSLDTDHHPSMPIASSITRVGIDDASVARFENHTLVALKIGSTHISYQYDVGTYVLSISASLVVSGTPPVAPATPVPSVVTNISLKKATITYLKSKTKKIVVLKYQKVENAIGYQIAYRKKGKKKWSYKTTRSTSYTLTKLTRKKYYYAKVRAYVDTSQGRLYGKYSATKKIRVK